MKRILFSICILFFVLSSCHRATVIEYYDEDQVTAANELDYMFFFTEALKNKNFGNINNAVIYFQKCIELDSTAHAPYYEISMIQSYFGNFKEALEFARVAYQRDVDNPWYLKNLASAYLQNNKVDSSIYLYKILIKRFNTVENNRQLAMLYERNGQFKSAIEIIDKLENLYGIVEQNVLYKNNLYHKLGDYKSAIKETSKLLNLEPDNIKYLTILAEAYANNGNKEKAISLYEQVLQADSMYTIALISYGNYLINERNYDTGFNFLLRAFKNKDLTIETKINLLSTYLFQNSIIYQENYDKFSLLFQALVDTYPDNIQVYALISDHYIGRKFYKIALKYLNKAIKIDNAADFIWEQYFALSNYFGFYKEIFEQSEHAMLKFSDKSFVYFYRGLSAWQLNKNSIAIEVLEKGLSYINDDKALRMQFYSILGELFHTEKRYSKSDFYFDEALKLDSNNVGVLNNYAYYLSLREAKLEKALVLSKRTIEVEPLNSTYIDTYAWILFKMKRYEEALTCIEEAMKNGGDKSAEIVEHYGDILYKNGELIKALEQWIKARSLGKNTDELNEKINSEKL